MPTMAQKIIRDGEWRTMVIYLMCKNHMCLLKNTPLHLHFILHELVMGVYLPLALQYTYVVVEASVITKYSKVVRPWSTLWEFTCSFKQVSHEHCMSLVVSIGYEQIEICSVSHPTALAIWHIIY